MSQRRKNRKPMPPKKKAEKTGRKPRTERKFPATTFEEALTLAKAIQDHAGGQKVRRLTLFEKLDQSPDSAGDTPPDNSLQPIRLTKGSYMAEYLELTPLGAEPFHLDHCLSEQVFRYNNALRKTTN